MPAYASWTFADRLCWDTEKILKSWGPCSHEESVAAESPHHRLLLRMGPSMRLNRSQALQTSKRQRSTSMSLTFSLCAATAHTM